MYFGFAINYSFISTYLLWASHRHRRLQIFLAYIRQQGEHMLNNKRSGRYRAVTRQDS